MSESQLQKDIMKAVKKVNKMNINMGQTQYQGRGEDSSEEVPEVAVQQDNQDQTSNIYDEEENKSYQAAKDIMKDIKKRFETVNLGEQDYTKMLGKLKKVQEIVGRGAVGGEADLKSKIKKLKDIDPKLYYKLKSKMEVGDKPKKKRSPAGGAKPKREMTEKQKEWMAFVKELSKKEKYQGMKRPELMKIASQKYKKQ